MSPDAPWQHRNPWLMAEIGVNHDGDEHRAAAMIRACAAAGFDAVKFQYWIIEELLAEQAPNAPYQGDGDQRDLLERLRLDLAQLRRLGAVAEEAGVDFVVTPDGELACADVVSLAPAALKIGSGDCDNPWLLDAAVRSGLPLVVSLGMTDPLEADRIVQRLRGAPEVALLHCVSAYPTPLEDAGLPRLTTLARFGTVIGYSDHTLGLAAPAAALALGARIVEKHVTWDPTAPGPDHAASLHLDDAGEWVATLRRLHRGLHDDGQSGDEQANRPLVRKGLYAARDLAAGEVLRPHDLRPLRPLLDGIAANERDLVVGRRVARPVTAGALLHLDDLEVA